MRSKSESWLFLILALSRLSNFLALALWITILPAISVNKGCCSYQAIILKPRWQSSLRDLRIEKDAHYLSSGQLLQPPPPVHPEETQDEKAQDTGLWELSCRWKEWFQWAKTLASFNIKRSAKFLEIIQFSLINSHLRYSDCLVFVAKIPMYPCSSSSTASSEQSLSAIYPSYLRCYVPGLTSQIK